MKCVFAVNVQLVIEFERTLDTEILDVLCGFRSGWDPMKCKMKLPPLFPCFVPGICRVDACTNCGDKGEDWSVRIETHKMEVLSVTLTF